MAQNRNWLSGIFSGISIAIVCLSVWFAWQWQLEYDGQKYRTQIFRDLIATTDNAIVILDPKGQIVEWGVGAELLFGWAEKEVLGSSPLFLMPEEYRCAHIKALETRNQMPEMNRSLVTVKCWAYHRSGELIPVKIVVASFKNHVGYYHMAMITAQNKVKEFDAVPKPDKPGPRVSPEPITTGKYRSLLSIARH